MPARKPRLLADPERQVRPDEHDDPAEADDETGDDRSAQPLAVREVTLRLPPSRTATSRRAPRPDRSAPTAPRTRRRRCRARASGTRGARCLPTARRRQRAAAGDEVDRQQRAGERPAQAAHQRRRHRFEADPNAEIRRAPDQADRDPREIGQLASRRASGVIGAPLRVSRSAVVAFPSPSRARSSCGSNERRARLAKRVRSRWPRCSASRARTLIR